MLLRTDDQDIMFQLQIICFDAVSKHRHYGTIEIQFYVLLLIWKVVTIFTYCLHTIITQNLLIAIISVFITTKTDVVFRKRKPWDPGRGRSFSSKHKENYYCEVFSAMNEPNNYV